MSTCREIRIYENQYLAKLHLLLHKKGGWYWCLCQLSWGSWPMGPLWKARHPLGRQHICSNGASHLLIWSIDDSGGFNVEFRLKRLRSVTLDMWCLFFDLPWNLSPYSKQGGDLDFVKMSFKKITLGGHPIYRRIFYFFYIYYQRVNIERTNNFGFPC
jgi:hypothetical protein